MTQRKISIPVIDLFAGPGGLSEGFSRHSGFRGSEVDFRIRLSVEMDPIARKTLRLRSFVRQFRKGRLPKAYYSYIRCKDVEEKEKILKVLKKLPEWRQAEKEAWEETLGEVDPEILHRRIQKALDGKSPWVLLGGPPCQVYSKIGRARHLGPGHEIRAIRDQKERDKRQRKKQKKFFGDVRHALYRDYLKVVAIHQPDVFVMENVRDILTARLPVNSGNGKSNMFVFDRILSDLRAPWAALKEEGLDDDRLLKKYGAGTKHGYKIHSFVVKADTPGEHDRSDYLIKCEKFGIPQTRHRVILLGVRDDIDSVPNTLKEKKGLVSVKSVIGDLKPLRSGRSRGREDSPSSWLKAIRDEVTDEMLDTVDENIRERMRSISKRRKTNRHRGGLFIPWDHNSMSCEKKLAKWILDPRLRGICQHETREHMDTDFARYLFVSVYGEVNSRSPKLRHFPKSLLPLHKNVTEEKSGKRRNRDFHDRFRVQVAESPASTIVSHIRRDGHYFIHYDPRQCRSLTVREAARIQTFPDNYFFEGNRTEQYEQVGNAVPPYLALQLAGVVAGVIKKLKATLKQKQRSYNMSRIPGKDTKPERIFRKALWSAGLKYRLRSKLPGKPDLVFPGKKVAVFVDGCFWHMCPEHYQPPKNNSEFWKKKITRNAERDKEVTDQLEKMGWAVIRVWGHELKNNLGKAVKRIDQALSDKS